MKIDQELDEIVRLTRRPRMGGRPVATGGAPRRSGGNGGGRRGPPRRSSFGGPGKRREGFSGFGGRRRSLSTSELRGSVKVHISNLDFGVSERDMRELFADFPGSKKVNVHYDSNGRSQGSCDVLFDRKASAIKAKKQYDGVPLDGRTMTIEIVGETRSMGDSRRSPRRSPRRGSPRRNGGGGNGGFRGGRGRGRGGRGPRREKEEVPTAEELDKQLDSYLTAGTN